MELMPAGCQLTTGCINCDSGISGDWCDPRCGPLDPPVVSRSVFINPVDAEQVMNAFESFSYAYKSSLEGNEFGKSRVQPAFEHLEKIFSRLKKDRLKVQFVLPFKTSPLSGPRES